MHLWISRHSEVPIREQITTQIILAIVSNDIAAGQKLPSTRELARRFRIHANTVSSAYRELVKDGWVEFRKGSGVYVRELTRQGTLSKGLLLDQIILTSLQIARHHGFTLEQIRERVIQWLEFQPPDHFLVVENEPELREILIREIHEATGFPTQGAEVAALADPRMLTGAALVALYGWAEEIEAVLPGDTACMYLRTRSVQSTLPVQCLRDPETLVVIASRWEGFLRMAKASCAAVGVDDLALDLRDARVKGWSRGLGASGTFVIADCLTALELPPRCASWVYRIISDASIEELRTYVNRFLPASV